MPADDHNSGRAGGAPSGRDDSVQAALLAEPASNSLSRMIMISPSPIRPKRPRDPGIRHAVSEAGASCPYAFRGGQSLWRAGACLPSKGMTAPSGSRVFASEQTSRAARFRARCGRGEPDSRRQPGVSSPRAPRSAGGIIARPSATGSHATSRLGRCPLGGVEQGRPEPRSDGGDPGRAGPATRSSRTPRRRRGSTGRGRGGASPRSLPCRTSEPQRGHALGREAALPASADEVRAECSGLTFPQMSTASPAAVTAPLSTP